MAAKSETLPDLDRRLQARRAEVADTLGQLKHRVSEEVRGLSPRRLVKRHPEVTLAAAGVAGLVAGHVAGRLLRCVSGWLA